LTERELLVAHAKIMALKQKYGLSYKDAAHCLYHSEVQKLNTEDNAYASISEMKHHIDQMVTEGSTMIMDIDHQVSEDMRGGVNEQS
jgi:hypothetical protein